MLHEVFPSTRAGFTLVNTSRASPRKLRQSSQMTFVSTLKLPSLILLFAQKHAKKAYIEELDLATSQVKFILHC